MWRVTENGLELVLETKVTDNFFNEFGAVAVRQRALAHEEVGAGGEGPERLARPRVARVDDGAESGREAQGLALLAAVG